MRTLKLGTRAAPALAVALAVASAAHAADVGAIGAGFKLKQSATKKTLTVISKDKTNVVLPASDPVATGGSLDVTLEAGATLQSETFSLPAIGWARSNATAKKFKGTVPGIKSVTVKAGIVKIKGEPSVLNLANAPYTAGHVILSIGTDRYCLDFTLPAIVNLTTQLKWTLQTSPGVCPTPSTTTSTTSSTSTTTLQTCGNGTPEGFEECDDGNAVDCDGCDSNCTLSTTCGNGIVCGSEQCDGGPDCNASCESTAGTCAGVTGQRLVVVSIATPQALAGVRIDLNYPAIQSSIPGSGGSSEVMSHVYVFQTGGVNAMNDQDNDLTAVFANTTNYIGSGPLFAANFDECTDISKRICNRAQTVTDCCNDPSNPNQFGNVCARYDSNGAAAGGSLSCSVDADCPGPDNTACADVSAPYPCCTGAGTGTCTPSSFCIATGNPLGCCSGSGVGTCNPPFGSCVIKCNTNPPVCSPGHFPSDPTLPDGPCDNVSGACPGDNECITQTSLTTCAVSAPTDASGNPVAGVSCSLSIL